MKFMTKYFMADVATKRIISERKSLRPMAEKIGISSATLNRIESGKMPDLLTYAKVCKWLKCKTDKYLKS